MTRLLVTIACLLTGCTGQLAAGAGIHGPIAPAPAGGGEVVVDDGGGPVVGYAPGEDRHWMQADDYFISDDPWERGWIWVHLAKMRQPPAAATKDQAQFFQLDDSRDVWTEHYWRTRPAAGGDLVLGALVICFNDNSRDDVYRAPANKRAARTGSWFLGKITDVSDAYKHTVRVDTYSCALDAVRAVGR
jgi:hypothetical protein